MKKIISFVLCTLIISFHTTIKPIVNWTGGDITLDVVDDDINLSGLNNIRGDILVSASTTDIAINVTGDSSLVGKLSAGFEAPHLVLFVDTGRTITFNSTNNLFFLDDTSVDFLITVSGSGDVVFVLDDDKRIAFGSGDPTYGTQFYVSMNNTESNTAQFKRNSNASSQNVEIYITANSIVSFIAEDGIDGNETTQGKIEFAPENSGTGRMIVKIEDTGCLLAQGNKIPQKTQRDIVLSDIDLSTPAGAQATIATVPPGTATNHAGLFVLTTNDTYPDLLIDPWFTGASVANRYGFIIGPNGVLSLSTETYLDYVGLAENFCPSPTIPGGVLNGRTTASLVKTRNPSALITDGDPNDIATPATISLADQSALYFRSGIDDNGSINYTNFAFTIDPADVTEGIGNIVFDIEGETIVDGTGTNKLEMLSLQIGTTGGSVLVGSSETTFPTRTFATSGSGYLQYNSACFFVNNKLTFSETNLVHSDINHQIFENDDTNSEPSYVGGDSFNIPSPTNDRPSMQFLNSNFLLHTSGANTGLDLIVPNIATTGNTCAFTCFHNGWEIDDGTGRAFILGTEIGAKPCGATNIISQDVNLTVLQTTTQAPSSDHILNITTEANDDTIDENISGTITTQYSTHLFYLGHDSNIIVGTGGSPGFSLTTNPTLNISGNYFSFETRGGSSGIPEQSSITGTGGIFVDENGVIAATSGIRCYMGVMVTKRGAGTITLPKSRVYFDSRVGISHWELDLTQASNRVVIAAGQNLSDYTLNWQHITKGYTSSDKPFVRYDLSCMPFANAAVTVTNISSLPTIQGSVDQLQISESRLGDEAYVMIDGGTVHECIFLQGSGASEIASAVIALQNNAYLGLGSLYKNQDSQEAFITLGVNGVTLIPNGNAKVELNENVIINNLCHILAGPDFGLQDNSFDPNFEESNPRADIVQSLEFHSDNGKALVIKAGGQLDLTSFKKSNQRVIFSGNAQLILEPGAQLFFDGGTLVMTDEARIVTQTAP